MHKSFPEKFDRESICKVVNELKEIDTTRILNNRIDELAVILYLIKSTGRELKEVELFEAGTCPPLVNNSLYSGNINFFFSNQPELVKYKGFDSDYNHVFPLKEKNEYYNGDPEMYASKPFEIINKAMEENTILEYTEFAAAIRKSEDPIVFSTYVFGCPQINRNQPFWQLPGTHIHIGGIPDFISEWTKKFHPKIHEKNDLHGNNYDLETIIPDEFLEKTEYKKSKEQWKIIGEELFDIKEVQVGFIDRSTTVYYYTVEKDKVEK